VERPTAYPDATQQPVANDPPGWWHEQLANLPSYPVMACDGTTVHEFRGEFIEADDPKERRFEVRSVVTLSVTGQKNDPLPVFWSRMPEFLMRPPLGIPREDMEPVLDAKATDGPADTVLVRVRRTRKDTEHIDGVEHPDFYRYWIDPSRGYICMRWEMGSDAPAADSALGSYLVEEVSRSPQGHWYPTAVRIKNAIRHEDGSIEDQIIRFYLEFAVELPDRLFQSAE
jgi:hypothetical protein